MDWAQTPVISMNKTMHVYPREDNETANGNSHPHSRMPVPRPAHPAFPQAPLVSLIPVQSSLYYEQGSVSSIETDDESDSDEASEECLEDKTEFEGEKYPQGQPHGSQESSQRARPASPTRRARREKNFSSQNKFLPSFFRGAVNVAISGKPTFNIVEGDYHCVVSNAFTGSASASARASSGFGQSRTRTHAYTDNRRYYSRERSRNSSSDTRGRSTTTHASRFGNGLPFGPNNVPPIGVQGYPNSPAPRAPGSGFARADDNGDTRGDPSEYRDAGNDTRHAGLNTNDAPNPSSSRDPFSPYGGDGYGLGGYSSGFEISDGNFSVIGGKASFVIPEGGLRPLTEDTRGPRRTRR